MTGSSNHPSPRPLPHQEYHPLAFTEKVLWLLILLSVLAKQNAQNTSFFPTGSDLLFTFATQEPKTQWAN